MYLVLILDNKVVDIQEFNKLKIINDYIEYEFNKGVCQLSGVKADVYVLESFGFSLGSSISDDELRSLDNLKNDYIGINQEERITQLENIIKEFMKEGDIIA